MERSAANAEGTDGAGGGDSDEGYRAVDDSLEINPSTDAQLLAASTPLLHVTTRKQDSLGGGNVSLEDKYTRCRNCATCRAPDCQGIHGADLFNSGCYLCQNGRPLLCKLREPCLD